MTFLVWAALRKEDFAEGTDCRVAFREEGNGYEVVASAREPDGPIVRVLEIRVPKRGFSEGEYSELVRQGGLTAFMSPPDGSVTLGGHPSADMPDSVKMGSTEVPRAGRNSPCPCGSGKKYKKCCLQ